MKPDSMLNTYLETMGELLRLDAHLATWCLAIVLWNNIIHDKVQFLLSSPELYKNIYSVMPIRFDYADDTTVYIANNRIMVDRESLEITFAEGLFSNDLMKPSELNEYIRQYKTAAQKLEAYFEQGKKSQSYLLEVLLPLYRIVAEKYGLPELNKMTILQVAISPNEKTEYVDYVLNTEYVVQTLNAFLEAHGYSSALYFSCTRGVCEDWNMNVVRFDDTEKAFPKTVQQDIQSMVSASSVLSKVMPGRPVEKVFGYDILSGEGDVVKSFSHIHDALYVEHRFQSETFLFYYGAFYHYYQMLQEDIRKHTSENEDIANNWQEYTISTLTMLSIMEHPNLQEKHAMLADLFASFERDEEMVDSIVAIKKAWHENPKEVWDKQRWLKAFTVHGSEKLKAYIQRTHLPQVEKALSWFKEEVQIGVDKAFKQHCQEAPGTAVPYGTAERQAPCA